jgi:hypothetical protein
MSIDPQFLDQVMNGLRCWETRRDIGVRRLRALTADTAFRAASSIRTY